MSELKAITSVFNIEIEKIDPNPNQPRKYFNDDALRDLSESIRRYGVMQPITVFRRETETPEGGIITRYEIIAGERRWRASILAGMNSIPAIIHEEEASEQERYELSILENLQREDLNPVDKARSFERLSNEFGMKHAEIADKLGKSREYVTNSMRLLILPENILDSLSNGYISEGHTRPLLSLKDNPEQMQVLFNEITTKGLNVRDTEKVGRELQKGESSSRNQLRAHVDLDPEMMELQKQLALSLGTSVSIDKKDQGGKVTIDFFSRDDLKKLLAMVGKDSASVLPNVAVREAHAQEEVTTTDQAVAEKMTSEVQKSPLEVLQGGSTTIDSSSQEASVTPTQEPALGNEQDTVPSAQARATAVDPRVATPQQEEDPFFKIKELHVLDTKAHNTPPPVSASALNLQKEIDNLVSQTSESELAPIINTTKSIDLGDIESIDTVYAEQAVHPAGTTQFKGELTEDAPSFGEKTPFEKQDAVGVQIDKPYPGTASEPVFGDTNSFVPGAGDSSATSDVDVSIAGDEFVPQTEVPTTQAGDRDTTTPNTTSEVTMGGLSADTGSARTESDPYNLNKFSI